jgi:hypothetical protein
VGVGVLRFVFGTFLLACGRGLNCSWRNFAFSGSSYLDGDSYRNYPGCGVDWNLTFEDLFGNFYES